MAEASGLAEADALDALDEAIAARLLLTADDRRGRYAFGHAVMRDALLDPLAGSRRMRLHARLADALERRHADAPGAVVSALAHHHREAGAAGEPAKALRFARAAGDAAMAQLAYVEAAGHYRVALDLPDAGAAQRGAPATSQGVGEVDRRQELHPLGDAVEVGASQNARTSSAHSSNDHGSSLSCAERP